MRKISGRLIFPMNAGHFCQNLLFRIDFSAGTSQSWHVSLLSFLLSLFLKEYMTFSKQTLIKHFVSAIEMGTLSLKNSLPCLCDRRAKLCTIWQRRLHEEPRRKAPYTYSSCLHFLAPATSWGFFLSLTSVTFSHFLISPLLLLRALRRDVAVTLGGLWRMPNPRCLRNATGSNSKLFLTFLQRHQFPTNLCLAVIIQTDGQSKAHHTLGAQNELKCAHRRIPFQNQYLYGKYLLKQQAQESAPAPDAPSETRKGKNIAKKIYIIIYFFSHWQDKTRWWLSFSTLSPLKVWTFQFKFFYIFHCGWGVCVEWRHMLWQQHETNRCQE